MQDLYRFIVFVYSELLSWYYTRVVIVNGLKAAIYFKSLTPSLFLFASIPKNIYYQVELVQTNVVCANKFYCEGQNF